MEKEVKDLEAQVAKLEKETEELEAAIADARACLNRADEAFNKSKRAHQTVDTNLLPPRSTDRSGFSIKKNLFGGKGKSPIAPRRK